jgi:hypothetical protein
LAGAVLTADSFAQPFANSMSAAAETSDRLAKRQVERGLVGSTKRVGIMVPSTEKEVKSYIS